MEQIKEQLYYSITEFAKIKCVSRQAIHKAIKDKRIEYTPFKRIPAAEIKKYRP